MDKQMIEEMAKLVQGDMCGDVPCEECNYHGKMKILPRYCGTYLIVEKLYNAGYRKIPEGAVVLTRKDREEFNELYRSALQRAEKWEKLCGIKIKETRKETAEKFAERLKEKLNEWLEDNEDLDGKINFGIAKIELIGVKSLDGEIIAESLIEEICKEITDKEVQNGN